MRSLVSVWGIRKGTPRCHALLGSAWLMTQSDSCLPLTPATSLVDISTTRYQLGNSHHQTILLKNDLQTTEEWWIPFFPLSFWLKNLSLVFWYSQNILHTHFSLILAATFQPWRWVGNVVPREESLAHMHGAGYTLTNENKPWISIRFPVSSWYIGRWGSWSVQKSLRSLTSQAPLPVGVKSSLKCHNLCWQVIH